jgi:hypothetical protein
VVLNYALANDVMQSVKHLQTRRNLETAVDVLGGLAFVAGGIAILVYAEQSSLGKEVMLVSEKSLMSLWMTPEEEEAWKDL